jgi:hypothetical protein
LTLIPANDKPAILSNKIGTYLTNLLYFSGLVFTTTFFITYEWAQKARVLHYSRLKRLARDTPVGYWADL